MTEAEYCNPNDMNYRENEHANANHLAFTMSFLFPPEFVACIIGEYNDIDDSKDDTENEPNPKFPSPILSTRIRKDCSRLVIIDNIAFLGITN